MEIHMKRNYGSCVQRSAITTTEFEIVHINKRRRSSLITLTASHSITKYIYFSKCNCSLILSIINLVTLTKVHQLSSSSNSCCAYFSVYVTCALSAVKQTTIRKSILIHILIDRYNNACPENSSSESLGARDQCLPYDTQTHVVHCV